MFKQSLSALRLRFGTSSRMELRGPCIYVKSADTFRTMKNPEIQDACIELNGEVTPLQQNTFWVERFDDSLYVYHSFQYYTHDGKLIEGRWFNRNMNLHRFKQMKQMFRHEILGEQGTTIIRVIFTEKVAAELREV